jgi:hypothetical protein
MLNKGLYFFILVALGCNHKQASSSQQPCVNRVYRPMQVFADTSANICSLVLIGSDDFKRVLADDFPELHIQTLAIVTSPNDSDEIINVLNKYENIDSLIITGDQENVPFNLLSICKNLKYFEGKLSNKYFQRKSFTGLDKLETFILYGQADIPLPPPGWTKYQSDSVYYLKTFIDSSYVADLISCLEQAPKLKNIALHTFELKNFPYTITNIEKLETLDLRDNDIAAADCTLLKIRNLRHLNLNNNCLIKYPPCVDGILVKPFQPGECK